MTEKPRHAWSIGDHFQLASRPGVIYRLERIYTETASGIGYHGICDGSPYTCIVGADSMTPCAPPPPGYRPPPLEVLVAASPTPHPVKRAAVPAGKPRPKTSAKPGSGLSASVSSAKPASEKGLF